MNKSWAAEAGESFDIQPGAKPLGKKMISIQKSRHLSALPTHVLYTGESFTRTV